MSGEPSYLRPFTWQGLESTISDKIMHVKVAEPISWPGLRYSMYVRKKPIAPIASMKN